MRIIPALALLFALAACGQRDPQVVAPSSLGLAAAPAAASAAIHVDGSAMTTSLQPRFGCAAYTFPLDGRAAFEAAMRSAAATNLRPPITRVDIRGERLRAESDLAGGLLQGAAVSVVAEASVAVDGGAARQVQATGRATSQASGLVGCDSIGPTLADAYRDALRALAGEVAGRMRASP